MRTCIPIRRLLAGIASIALFPAAVVAQPSSASIQLSGELQRKCLVSISTGSGGLITGLLPILRNLTVISIDCNFSGAPTLALLQRELQIPTTTLIGLVIEPLELRLFGGRSFARYRLTAQPSAINDVASAVAASQATPGQTFTATLTPN